MDVADRKAWVVGLAGWWVCGEAGGNTKDVNNENTTLCAKRPASRKKRNTTSSRK